MPAKRADGPIPKPISLPTVFCEVHWWDHSRTTSTNRAGPFPLEWCITRGWLMEEDDYKIVMAATLATTDEADITTIRKELVFKRKRLRV